MSSSSARTGPTDRTPPPRQGVLDRLKSAFARDPVSQRRSLARRRGELEGRSEALRQQYEDLFKRPDVCQRMRLVDLRSIGLLNKGQLRAAATVLGMDAQEGTRKDAMCRAVQAHYLRRVDVLQRIAGMLDQAEQRLDVVLAGDYCHDDTAVTGPRDRRACEVARLSWAPELPKYDHRAPENASFVKAVRQLQSVLQAAVEACEGIVDKLLDGKGVLDATLESMEATLDTHAASLDEALREFVALTAHARSPTAPAAAARLYTEPEIRQMRLQRKLDRELEQQEIRAQRRAYAQLAAAKAQQIRQHYDMTQATTAN